MAHWETIEQFILNDSAETNGKFRNLTTTVEE